jgi:hypothetical protein
MNEAGGQRCPPVFLCDGPTPEYIVLVEEAPGVRGAGVKGKEVSTIQRMKDESETMKGNLRM